MRSSAAEEAPGLPSVGPVRHIHRRADDADVIRARLRALLDDGTRGGWVPEDDDVEATSWIARAPQDGNAPEDDADEPAGADGERPAGVGLHRAPGRVVRWAPGRRGARSLWTAGLIAALVVIGGTWLDRPRVEPVSPVPTVDGAGTTPPPAPSPEVGEAAETSTTAVVAVVGLVARPGLVTVPAGARIADAVEAAGGFLPGADPAAVNLAAVITDGQQIAVGVPGSSGSAEPAAPGAAGGAQVNLNTATAEELDALPGIGPVRAQRIVAHRGRMGHFRSVEELDDVPGIGPAIAAALVDLVTV